ncbi:MAG: MFS transporter, partial [Anaerolineales bacterium]
MLKDFRDPKEFPRPFWILMGATFIDRVGAFLLLPFFALYVTDHFGLSMTGLGQVVFVFAFAGTLGGFIGGAIADKFGRRAIILFGLVTSALSSLLMGYTANLSIFFVLTFFVGLLQDVGGPAQSALVADVLPVHRQSEGYSIWRVVANVAAIIGPLIGGFLADRNFLLLFIADAVLSLITAVFVFFALPETKPETKPGQVQQSFFQTAVGYRKVLRDRVFMAFILIASIGVMVYSQMNTSLPVYLRDIENMPSQNYGYLLALNAVMVVAFQFWITRRIKGFAPLLVMSFGTLFLAVGFGMYGFFGGLLYFGLAMAIITVGEMIIAPSGQALAARLAPEDMRGRYMAMFAFSWSFPFALGPVAAGYLTDNFSFNWVWYASGIAGFVCV